MEKTEDEYTSRATELLFPRDQAPPRWVQSYSIDHCHHPSHEKSAVCWQESRLPLWRPLPLREVEIETEAFSNDFINYSG